MPDVKDARIRCARPGCSEHLSRSQHRAFFRARYLKDLRRLGTEEHSSIFLAEIFMVQAANPAATCGDSTYELNSRQKSWVKKSRGLSKSQ